MAPPRKPMLELENPSTVGFKTTSMRLQGNQWAQVDMFSRAMGISVNEFIQRSVDAYLKHVAKKPEVQTALKKQINQQRRMLDNMLKMTGLTQEMLNEATDNGEVDEDTVEEDFDEFEEVEEV
jgi:cell division FtsZ-interacting protein ZapD